MIVWRRSKKLDQKESRLTDIQTGVFALSIGSKTWLFLDVFRKYLTWNRVNIIIGNCGRWFSFKTGKNKQESMLKNLE